MVRDHYSNRYNILECCEFLAYLDTTRLAEVHPCHDTHDEQGIWLKSLKILLLKLFKPFQIKCKFFIKFM